MVTYTIMEFNTETKKWKPIGYSDARNSSDAKRYFVTENGWSPDGPNTILFAKPPICRQPMKARNAKVGQLLKTSWGYVTIVKFFAPSCIGCIIVSKSKEDYTAFKIGEWIYLRGFDLEQAEIIA